MKHIFRLVVLLACVSAAHAAVWLDSYSFPQSQPTRIRTDEVMPANYRLRAKFWNVPGYGDFHAATSNSNNGFLLDSVPPSGVYTAELYWVKYDSSWALVSVGPMTVVTITVAAADVSLESYAFMSTQDLLPRIFTAAAHVPFEPYKLRAKFIDPVTGSDFHAATSINNNNLPLDASPAPKNYNTVSLYWVRYDATGNSVLQVGAERIVSASVTQGTVALSSYYFAPGQAPAITTNEPMPPGQNYRLRATFAGVSGYPNGFESATANNNNGALLDALPPAGTYTVSLQWTKYDASWANPQYGPVTEKTVTITDRVSVLSGTGHIEMTPVYDQSGNITGYTSSTVLHDFYVSSPGVLRLWTTGWVDTSGSLYDPNGQLVGSADAGGEYNNFYLSANVAAGWYRLAVVGKNSGDYQVFGEMGPPPNPTVSILGGNSQTTDASLFNPLPLDVAVWNELGTAPLVGTDVTFTVTQGGGRLATTNVGTPSLVSALTLQTDVDGTAQVYFKQPATVGVEGLVRAVSGGSGVTYRTLSTGQGVVVDNDLDGAPDDWEYAHFGHAGVAASIDSDGDGLTNLQEYQAGSNPVDFFNGRGFTIVTPESSLGSTAVVYSHDASSRLTGATYGGGGTVTLVFDAASNLTSATSAPGPLSPIQIWRQSHGLPIDGSGDGADSAILAADGLPNLAKYAFGLAPRTAVTSSQPQISLLAGDASSYLSLAYQRPDPAPSDLVYTVEVSADGITWTSGATATVNLQTGSSNGMADVKVRDATATSQTNLRRIRIKIERVAN